MPQWASGCLTKARGGVLAPESQPTSPDPELQPRKIIKADDNLCRTVCPQHSSSKGFLWRIQSNCSPLSLGASHVGGRTTFAGYPTHPCLPNYSEETEVSLARCLSMHDSQRDDFRPPLLRDGVLGRDLRVGTQVSCNLTLMKSKYVRSHDALHRLPTELMIK